MNQVIMTKEIIESQIKLSSSNPTNLIELLNSIGFSQHQIFSQTSLNQDVLKSSKNQISYKQYKQLIQRAIDLTQNPAIGLEFGQHLNTSGMGIIGMGAMACKTGLDVLEFNQRCLPVINPAIHLNLNRHEKDVTVSIEEVYPWGELTPFMVDVAYIVCTNFIKILSPNDLNRIVYHMTYSAKPDESIYREHLPGKLHFNSTFNRMIFPMDILEKSMPFHNPTAVKEAEELLDQQIDIIGHSKLSILESIKITINECQPRLPSMDEISSQLNMSSRTLARKLNSIGINFNDIITEEKRKRALTLLKNTQFSIDEISYMLDYKHPSNFSSAFKRWTGRTPSEFRTENLKNY